MRNEEYVFGVDLDQVGFDYAQGVRQIILDSNNELTVDDFPELIDYCFVVSKWPTLKTIEDYQRTHIAGVEQGFFQTLDVYEGFPQTIKMLRENGVVIRIITHRIFPGSSPAKSISDTAHALENAGVEYDEICFAKRKSDVRCDALVDDSPKNILDWKERNDDNSPCIIFDHPYNRDIEGPRVTNWEELGQLILDHKATIGK